MATTRLLRTSTLSSSSSSFSNISHTSPSTTLSMRLNKVDDDKMILSAGKRKSVGITAAVATSDNAAAAAAVTTNTQIGTGTKFVDVAFLIEMLKLAGIRSLKVVTRKRPWRFIIQMFIEKVILDCRFFATLAVAGSLLGSVLCFVEGCFMIVRSYLQYFHVLSLGADKGHVVQLLIEAIDMYLVGTAMLIFGMGLHVMFVGARNLNANGSLPQSNFFGLFYLRKIPAWVGMGSITEAKSKIGHALMMILQVGVLDKFKSIPMATGLDLACFAAAVFVSSTCIFLLSKLSFTTAHR